MKLQRYGLISHCLLNQYLEGKIMNLACEIRELVAGDIVVVSYDVIDNNSLAD